MENNVGKGENAGYQHFLFFPQCFQKASFSRLLKGGIVWYRFNPFPNDKLYTLQNWKRFADDNFKFNPFPNKPWSLCVCFTSFLKTLWEKEKLLDTNNFSFSHSVFYPFWELSAIFIKFGIIVCKHFQFGRV